MTVAFTLDKNWLIALTWFVRAQSCSCTISDRERLLQSSTFQHVHKVELKQRTNLSDRTTWLLCSADQRRNTKLNISPDASGNARSTKSRRMKRREEKKKFVHIVISFSLFIYFAPARMAIACTNVRREIVIKWNGEKKNFLMFEHWNKDDHGTLSSPTSCFFYICICSALCSHYNKYSHFQWT